MIRGFVAGVACIAAGAVAAGAQVAHLRDAGQGPGPDMLVRALAEPYVVVEPGPTPYLIPAQSTKSLTMIALGRSVIVDGTVHGDVFVIGADLYVHPGARIDGRAIAIGGAVYESMLAHTGKVTTFGDFTYDITPILGGYTLSYRVLSTPVIVKTVTFPGIKGFQIPAYDRTNGVSLPLAISIAAPHAVEIVPRVTYRSQLGRADPSVGASAQLDRRTTAQLDVGRATFTNDAWIWSDLINSAEYALVGDDARNYFRATRAQVKVARLWASPASVLEPYVAIRLERAWSVRPDSMASGGPWAFKNRRDHDDVLRANPPVDPARIFSMLAGADWTAASQGVIARVRLDEEIGHRSNVDRSSPPSSTSTATAGSSFAQTTFDGGIEFPTFGLQRLRVDAHAIATIGSAPRQRWAYVGGPGTIPTLDLLERGGDRLFYVDARYDIPLALVALPVIGSPLVTLRETLGGAGISGFPTLAQATGVRLSVSFVYLEVLVDPLNRKVFTGAGLSLAR